MREAQQRSQTRTRERRQRLAHEAARLMAEGGVRDYHQAKLKAAERLGIHDDAALPRNSEVEEALRQYQRLFSGDVQRMAVSVRRQAAMEALTFFAAFHPRVVGPVLDGTADSSSAVQLHLHSDDADAIARFLDGQGIPAELRDRRIRLDREREMNAPAWLFSAGDLVIDVLVLPYDALRQAPLSVVDGRPMRRASITQLRELIAQDEAAGHEGPMGSDGR